MPATRTIRRRFGLKNALDYLVSEKLLSFAEAAERHSEFALSFPDFRLPCGKSSIPTTLPVIWLLCVPCPGRSSRNFSACGVLRVWLANPGSHLFLTFFRWLEANRAEREPCQGRGCGAIIGAKRRPLTRLPRSVHSSAKKWERCFSQDAYAEDPTSTTVPG